MRRQRLDRIIRLHLLLFLHGAGGFAGQLIWVRRLGWGLGAELPSVLAITSAVLAGLALGAWLPDRWAFIRRRPVPTYVAANLLAAVWLPASGLWLADWSARAGGWLGASPSFPAQWAVSFLGALGVLLPALLGLGLALPAMEAVMTRLDAAGRWAASLYAAQTGGALVGLLGGGLWAAARWGDLPTLGAAGVALAASAGGLALAARRVPTEPPAAREERGGKGGGSLSAKRLGGLLAATGFLGLGLEMLVIRGLREQLEGTVYTHGLVLAVYLAGSTAGAAWRSRRGADRWPLRRLLAGLAWASGWSGAALVLAGGMYDGLRGWVAGGLGAALGAEAGVALAVLFPAAWWMGATFAELIESWRARTGRTGTGLALNLAGGALAPAVSIGGLVRLAGVEGAVGLLVAGYALCAACVSGEDERGLPKRRSGLRRWPELLAGGLGLMLAIAARPWVRHAVPLAPGSRVVAERTGPFATVRVIEDADGHRTLRVGRHWNMGGTGSARRERLQGHLALLWHPAPHRALFLGAGTGITLSAAEAYPNLEAVGIELLPEVVALASWFAPASGIDHWPARLDLRCADARRYVAASPGAWDVVVGDLFHPGREGAAALFTAGHFARVREALRPGGVFVQWLPLHQLQGRALRSVIRTFLHAFPEAWAFWLEWDIDVPVLGLVGGGGPMSVDLNRLEAAMAAGASAEELKAVGLRRPWDLWGRVAADRKRLEAWADGAPINRDDHPVLAFLAPTWTVDLRRAAWDPVRDWLALSPMGGPEARDLLGSGAPEPTVARLAACWSAGRAWMAGLIAEADGRSDRALELWLESVRRSADFNRAYARCLTLAAAWADQRPGQARQLLEALDRLRPTQPAARRLLERLDAP